MDLASVSLPVAVHLLPGVVYVAASNGQSFVGWALFGVSIISLAISVVGEMAQKDAVPVEFMDLLPCGVDGCEPHVLVAGEMAILRPPVSTVSNPEGVVITSEKVNVAVEPSDNPWHGGGLEGEVSEVEDLITWLHHGVPALDEVLVHLLQFGELIAHEVEDSLVLEVVIARVVDRHNFYNSSIAVLLHKVL